MDSLMKKKVFVIWTVNCIEASLNRTTGYEYIDNKHCGSSRQQYRPYHCALAKTDEKSNIHNLRNLV